MRESLGSSMLLNLVLIFSGVVIMLFVSILSYSKAYKVKNRIIEIIEKYGVYEKVDSLNLNNAVTLEINADLKAVGYNASIPSRCDNVRDRLINISDGKYKEENLSENLNDAGYNYCVFEVNNKSTNSTGRYYVVVTFIHFEVPVVGDLLTIPVYGETQMLGKSYNY